MRTRVILAATLASLLAGCLDVGTDASVDLSDDYKWDLGDGGAMCAGTSVKGDTTTVYSLQGNGDCRLDVTWSGNFLDVAMVKNAIKNNVDGYPDKVTVTLTGMNAEFTHINLTNASGADVTPSIVPHFDAALIVGSTQAASFQGDNLASLLGQVRSIDLGVLVDPANNALDSDTNLHATGHAVLVFSAASYRLLDGVNGIQLQFHANLHFDVHGSESLFDLI